MRSMQYRDSSFEVVRLLLESSGLIQVDQVEDVRADDQQPLDDVDVQRISAPTRRVVNDDHQDEDDIAWYPNFLDCLCRNRPCVFTAEFTAAWPSRKEWVDGEIGGPSWKFLSSTFGEAMVPIANCEVKHYNSQLKTDMKFADYLDYWRTLVANNHDYEKYDNLYLKDWHFVRKFSNYCAYETPFCFKNDWLNEFWTTKRTDKADDYRFVYMGPKGSWTPLHKDVFDSYSWSANICGLKKWIMFPPSECDNLKDVLGNLAYDVLSMEMDDETVYPNYGNVKQKVEIIQRAGEVVFVPSRWYHQVHNLRTTNSKIHKTFAGKKDGKFKMIKIDIGLYQEDTISVNHNWFNAFNVNVIWESMNNMVQEVQKEIEDCKDMDCWDDQCQLILKSTYGMDFDEFAQLLCAIASSRLSSIRQWIVEWGDSFKIDCHADIASEGGRRAIEGASWIFDLTTVDRTLREVNKICPARTESFADLLEDIATVLATCREIAILIQ